MLNYRVKEIAKAHRIEVDCPNRDYGFFRKVVVSTAYLDENYNGFVVMAVHRGGKLFVWRNIGNKLVYIGRDYDSFDSSFEYIVYDNEKFYALGHTGLTITVDSKSLTVTEVIVPPPNLKSGSRFLVKSFKHLFLVDKYENGWVDVNVFRLDEQKLEWVEVRDELEDRALFVGADCSFSVSTKEFPGCKGNCVYFVNGYSNGNDYFPGMDTGIFDLNDGNDGPVSAFPGYSKLFWPPPAWLKLHCNSAPGH